ncbi:MAG: EFR1 family ferrodoxin [Marinilabiliaceae bacterium]|jgi:ferredoxin|nr:EFR1 family ferrodoxin [Marinilabiliaceae bacterium]
MIESGKSCRIYYLTGTGNSYFSASTISNLAEESGYNVLCSPVDSLRKKEISRASKNDIVVLCYPTHGFSLPWHMLKFVFKFPAGRAKFILVNNRAGMKMGKLFTPGLSGIAILLPMLLMLLKGYRISALVPLDTPSNWISIHPGLRQKIIESIISRRKTELEKAWRKVSLGKIYCPLKFLILLPLDILVVPISFGYMLFGRFLLARTYLADPGCDGCGICADRCPVSAIKMIGERPWWTYKCESCMRCSNVCPKKAVNSSVPLMAIYTILLLAVIKTEVFTIAVRYLSGLSSLVPYNLVYYLVIWIIVIAGSWIIYLPIHYLNRISLFGYFFAFTTPMKFWRRYIAPGFRGRSIRHQTPSERL